MAIEGWAHRLCVLASQGPRRETKHVVCTMLLNRVLLCSSAFVLPSECIWNVFPLDFTFCGLELLSLGHDPLAFGIRALSTISRALGYPSQS